MGDFGVFPAPGQADFAVILDWGALQFRVPKISKNRDLTRLVLGSPRYYPVKRCKVVSLLKRFGRPMEAACKNRNFAPKFCLSELYIHTVISWVPHSLNISGGFTIDTPPIRIPPLSKRLK